MDDALHFPEMHFFQKKGRRIAFDISNSRVFSVDDLVFDILSFGSGITLSAVYAALMPRYEQTEISNALDELGSLRLIQKEPFLPDPLDVKFSARHPMRNMDFILSQDCNMRCRYCFADTGAYKGTRSLMRTEVARKAVDFMLDHSMSEKRLHITFFGGEPLLNIPVMKDTVEYGNMRAKELGKEISFSMSTNGTLMSDELIGYFKEQGLNVQVSIDGDKKTQDRNRPYLGNRGTYDDVIRNAQILMQTTGKRIPARTTVTAWSIEDLCDNCRHLLGQGFFSVHIETASGTKGKVFIKTQMHVEKLKRQFDLLADDLLIGIKEKRFVGYHNFVRIIQALNVNSKKAHPCGAGRGYLCVGVNGDLFPCHRFVGNGRYFMGNVFNGSYDDGIERVITDDIAVIRRQTCKDCWARHLCGGDCIAASEEAFGDIRVPDPLKCELNKYVIELAMVIYANIPRSDKAEIEKLYELPTRRNKARTVEPSGSVMATSSR